MAEDGSFSVGWRCSCGPCSAIRLFPPMRFIRHWFQGRVRRSLAAAVAATASALRSRTTHVESFSRATHTAREHESAPLYVGGDRRLPPGRGRAAEGKRLCGSGRRKRKEPFCAAPHQQRQHTTVSTSTLTTSAPLAAQITFSSMAQGQRRAACLWWRMRATSATTSESKRRREISASKGYRS